jgi:hypothetical protein
VLTRHEGKCDIEAEVLEATMVEEVGTRHKLDVVNGSH